MKKKHQKLTLSRETVRALEVTTFGRVVGGVETDLCPTSPIECTPATGFRGECEVC